MPLRFFVSYSRLKSYFYLSSAPFPAAPLGAGSLVPKATPVAASLYGFGP